MEHALRGVLLTVMSADRCDEVLQTALGIACERFVPEEAERARDFVERAVRVAVSGIVDDASADAVLDGMDPILQMAGSHVRPTNSSARNPELADLLHRPSTAPTPVALVRPAGGDFDQGLGALEGNDVGAWSSALLPSTVPPPSASLTARPPVDDSEPVMVLVATLDQTGTQGIARKLYGRGVVRQVTDIFELISALEARGGHRSIVVIDCCLPAVDPVSVATLVPQLPPGSHIVQWGGTERLRREVEAASPGARRWIHCTTDATHEDLATLIVGLV